MFYGVAMFPTKDALAHSLTTAALPAALADLARPAALLRPEAGLPQRVGESRFGGHPDLPPHLDWPWIPRYDIPMPFLAQINLADVRGMSGLDLPRSGHLYFFYDTEGQPWGYEDFHKEGFRLLYARDHGLVPREAPAGTHVLPAHRLLPEAVLSMPGSWQGDERYSGWHYRAPDTDGVHHLGGHPVPIQGPVEGFGRVLLAEFTSGGKGQWQWGDHGRLYVTISRAALRQRRWRDARLELQCY